MARLSNDEQVDFDIRHQTPVTSHPHGAQTFDTLACPHCYTMSFSSDPLRSPSDQNARTGSFPEHPHEPAYTTLNTGDPGRSTDPPSGSTSGNLAYSMCPRVAPSDAFTDLGLATLPRGSESSLTVLDNRTNCTYSLPIEQNSIQATAFQKIKTPRNEENPVEQNSAGIRIFDPGFQNTACMKSEITYVDGDAGEIAYRGTHVADLFYSGRPFEHVAFLLIFGHLPSESEAATFNTSIATSEMPPQAIFDTINNLPCVHSPT